MAAKFVSKRNLKFLLFEVFDVESLTAYDEFSMHNGKTFDLVIDAALKVARDMLWPILKEMDTEPPKLVDGQIVVHPRVRHILKEMGEGGWITANFPEELDGGQLPLSIAHLCRFIFAAANYSAAVYPDLIAGAAHLLISYGSKALQDTFLPNMISGKWQGTMALTEPQAGSSLADITTTAYPTDDGYYRIRGQKIFTSAGDHDAVENVVHLMLARIDGAPPGIKGISLFVVPKRRIAEDGTLIHNDITVSQVYHKLGYRGTPLPELSVGDKDDCRGYLVGEPHQGLRYMFQMMNEARIEVGLGATGIATAAYYAALDYAAERPQGRRLLEKDPTKPQVAIIEHADVKRMLLFQKSIVEGSLSLLLQCCRYADIAHAGNGEESETAKLLLEILTPVAKTYPSEMGILSVSQSLQCLGGYGYCDDFPLEQYYRDIRIHPIHEGTTAIQGMDLLGRKMLMKEGRAAALFLKEVQQTIARSEDDDQLYPYAQKLDAALNRLQEVTVHLVNVAQEKGPEVFLADATLFLQFFGTITVAWQWLKQALTARAAMNSAVSRKEKLFYEGKVMAFRYFFSYELPNISGLAERLLCGDEITTTMTGAQFAD